MVVFSGSPPPNSIFLYAHFAFRHCLQIEFSSNFSRSCSVDILFQLKRAGRRPEIEIRAEIGPEQSSKSICLQSNGQSTVHSLGLTKELEKRTALWDTNCAKYHGILIGLSTRWYKRKHSPSQPLYFGAEAARKEKKKICRRKCTRK